MSSTSSKSICLQKSKRTKPISKIKYIINSDDEEFDLIKSFDVFDSEECNISLKTTRNKVQYKRIQQINKNSESENEDFLPKTPKIQSKLSRSTKKKSNTVLETTPRKLQCLSNTSPVPGASGSSPSKLIAQIKINSPTKQNSSGTSPKINVIKNELIKQSNHKTNQTLNTKKDNENQNAISNINKKNVLVQTDTTEIVSLNNNLSLNHIVLRQKLNVCTQTQYISECITLSEDELSDDNTSTMSIRKSKLSTPEIKSKNTPKVSNRTGKLQFSENTLTKITNNLKLSTSEPISKNKCSKKLNYSKQTPSKKNGKYTQSLMSNYLLNKNVSPPKTTNKSPENKNSSKTNSKYNQDSHTRLIDNVRKIMDWVFDKEYFNILFTKKEHDILSKLLNLPDQRTSILCLRLLTRQHKWYNLSNLCSELNLNDEGYNLKKFLTHINEDFVDSDYSKERIETLLGHLNNPDLKDICSSLKINVPLKKDLMISKLLEYTNKQCTLTFLKNSDQILRDRVSEKLGICIKLKTDLKEILNRIHLLYALTNPELETINDIYNLMYKLNNNLIKFPNVQIDSSKIFGDRQDFIRYYTAYALRKDFLNQVKNKDINSQYMLCVKAHESLLQILSDEEQLKIDTTKPLFLRRFSASWIYCKVLSFGSQQLSKHYSDEVCNWLNDMLKQEIYCIYKRGQWYIQLSLIKQAHKKDFIAAANYIIEGINDKHVTEVHKQELSIRGSKINVKKIPQLLYDKLNYALLPIIKVPVEKAIEAKAVQNYESGKKLTFVRVTSEGKEYSSVEETAKNYYTKKNFTHGIHCEGRLFTTLFVIFFYDILFEMKIPNTFITEMQKFPLDLFSTDFYTNRSDKINERLNNIRNNWSLEEICNFFSAKFTNHTDEIALLADMEVSQEVFHEIIRSIDKKILAAALERLAKDYKQYHSGLPDLFLWNKNEFKCAFVEVKSEKDKLSTKQILWINYLHKFNAQVEVCHVLSVGSKLKKKKVNENNLDT